MVSWQALADLNTAYRNFFTRDSRFTVLDNGRLRPPKIGGRTVRWG
ncbi:MULTISPECIES: hypothetical protein [unclassified Micromonospora]